MIKILQYRNKRCLVRLENNDGYIIARSLKPIDWSTGDPYTGVWFFTRDLTHLSDVILKERNAIVELFYDL